MHDAEREAERALARWAVGEMDLEVALRHLCASFGEGTSCAVVREEPAELLGLDRRGEHEAVFFAMAARARAGQQIDLVLDETPARWAVAAAAVGPEGDTHGTLVIVGHDEAARASARVALVPVARICAAMLASEDAGRAAAAVAHKMNNLLAAAMANVAYACTVVEAADAPGVDGDLARALKNTRDSANLVAIHAQRLVKLATKGR